MRSGSEVRGSRSVTIHPTAIVDPEAELAEGVEVGPYSLIAGTVKIGPGTVIGPRVTIEGHTTLGADNEIFTGAVIGSRTQDKKFDGGTSYLRIGDRNRIREYVTINPGTKTDTETRIGDDNLLMAYAHVAHDCLVKNRTILANVATLAGHVVVEDGAIIGGLSAVHQFVKIGRLALIGGCSKVTQDVPPYILADGHPASFRGINAVGLERAQFSAEDRELIKKIYRRLFKSGMTLAKAVESIQSEFPENLHRTVILDFVRQAERGICR